MSFDVFISYRQDKGKDLSSSIFTALTSKGFACFLDVTETLTGEHRTAFENAIKKSNNMMLIITKGSLERTKDSNDIVRFEIETALKYGVNIIPVSVIGDDIFRELADNNLPKTVRKIKDYHIRLYDHRVKEDTMQYIEQVLRDTRTAKFTQTSLTALESLKQSNKNEIDNYLEKVDNFPFTYEGDKYVYTGYLKFGKPFGDGILTDPSQNRVFAVNFDFTGTFRGKGKVFQNGELIYIGEIDSLKYSGNGELHEYDGVYRGTFNNGKKNGKGVKKFDDGVIFDGEWLYDNFEGTGYVRDKNGYEYYGTVVDNGIPMGYGTYIKGNCKLEGYFRYGKLDEGIIIEEDRIYSGQFDDEQPHGKGSLYTAKKMKVFEGQFRNGIPRGTGSFFLTGKQIRDQIIPFEIYSELKLYYNNFDDMNLVIKGTFVQTQLDDYSDFKIYNNDTQAIMCEGEYNYGDSYKYDIFDTNYNMVTSKR